MSEYGQITVCTLHSVGDRKGSLLSHCLRDRWVIDDLTSSRQSWILNVRRGTVKMIPVCVGKMRDRSES